MLENVVNFATLFILIGRSIRHPIGRWVLFTLTNTRPQIPKLQIAQCRCDECRFARCHFYLHFAFSLVCLWLFVVRFTCATTCRRIICLVDGDVWHQRTSFIKNVQAFRLFCSHSTNFSAKLFTLFVAISAFFVLIAQHPRRHRMRVLSLCMAENSNYN